MDLVEAFVADVFSASRAIVVFFALAADFAQNQPITCQTP
jgi:hypothetical protein